MSNFKPGWNWLHNARKWHYFVAGKSLCRGYMVFGSNEDSRDDNDDSPDNCAKCRRLLAARRVTE